MQEETIPQTQKEAFEVAVPVPQPPVQQNFTVTGGPETLIEIKQKEAATDVLFPERIVHPDLSSNLAPIPHSAFVTSVPTEPTPLASTPAIPTAPIFVESTVPTHAVSQIPEVSVKESAHQNEEVEGMTKMKSVFLMAGVLFVFLVIFFFISK